MTLTVW